MTSDEFIAAIENVLWVKNAEAVFLNPKDYTTYMTAFSRKRYEPNTHVQHLKAGWVGTYGTFEEPGFWCEPKPVYVRREVPEGTVLGGKHPPAQWPPVIERETSEALFPKSEWHELYVGPTVKLTPERP